MITTLTMVGQSEVLGRLSRMPRDVDRMLLRKISKIVKDLQRYVQASKLSGQVLRVRTGALRRSIQSDASQSGSEVVGRVFSTGDVKYAGIHEYGGRTKAHIIEPRKAKALAFMVGGRAVFARRVNHPGSTMPERSFLRSSLRDRHVQIVSEIIDGIEEVARGAG